MALTRIIVQLSGFSGGPGVNVWHLLGTAPISTGQLDAVTDAFRDLYTTRANSLQSDVDVLVPNEATELDVATGQPTNVVTGTTGPLSVAGGSTATFSHFLCGKVQLRTGVYQDGRQIQGGPFIGPWGSPLGADGLQTSATISAWQDALSQLLSDVSAAQYPLAVYRRPRPAGALPARAGQAALVTSATLWNKPSVQRSRRD